ncbi:response regulator [Cohnella algarum]|uniref:response regulator n=1 Tax=Cohnella algarum TaxID=2044859 RepID=UPI0019672785|nr:response regulator [Cohnella algarum]MBN2983166.1 response regulator [Cohnella algarum]
MLRVLIVDDEEWTRISIREQMDWAKLGMEIAGEARNGQAALEMIRENPPHLLITDIRMPVMDGIQLLERVHREFPHILCVMLSGYSEFEYAQKAVTYQAFDYVLKPIDEDQLERTLLRAAAKLKEDETRENSLIELHIKVNESGPLTKERLLTRLATEPGLNASQIRQTAAKAGLAELWPKMAVLVLQADNFAEIARTKYKSDAGLTSFVMLNLLEELLQPLGDGVVFRKYGQQNEFVWIKGLDEADDERELNELYAGIHSVMDKIERLNGLRLIAGVGREFTDAADAVHSYEEAAEAVRNAGIVHEGRIVHTDEVSSRNQYYMYPDDKEKALLYYVENGYRRQVRDQVGMLFDEWKASVTIHPDSIRNTMHELTVSVRKLLKKYNAVLEQVLQPSEQAGIAWSELQSYDQMKQGLEAMLEAVMAFLGSAQKTGAKKAVGEIIHYIDKNYGREISLYGVAETFHLNPAYLSRMFKNEAGTTFNEYVSQVRMEAAARLLSEEQLKVNDISALVGYENVSYFLKKFKDYYGCTPSEYRKNRT